MEKGCFYVREMEGIGLFGCCCCCCLLLLLLLPFAAAGFAAEKGREGERLGLWDEEREGVLSNEVIFFTPPIYSL